jgi:hypothetical protein
MLTRYHHREVTLTSKYPGKHQIDHLKKQGLEYWVIGYLHDQFLSSVNLHDGNVPIDEPGLKIIKNHDLLLLAILDKNQATVNDMPTRPDPNLNQSMLKEGLRFSADKTTIRVLAKILTYSNLTKTQIKEELQEREDSKLWSHPSGKAKGIDGFESKVIELVFVFDKPKIEPPSQIEFANLGGGFEILPWNLNRNTIVPLIPKAKPGLKQEFDLMDGSEKVITLLSRIMMSNIWSPCTLNIYGNAF